MSPTDGFVVSSSCRQTNMRSKWIIPRFETCGRHRQRLKYYWLGKNDNCPLKFKKKVLLTTFYTDEAPLGVHGVPMEFHKAGEDSGDPLTVEHRTVPENLVVNVGHRNVMLFSLWKIRYKASYFFQQWDRFDKKDQKSTKNLCQSKSTISYNRRIHLQ